jgi:hypothetical protein
MQDDDEERFPRISLRQFLKGVILMPLAFFEFLFGHGFIAALISERRARRKQPDSGPPDRTWPQAPDKID